jgi:hypothetical protein
MPTWVMPQPFCFWDSVSQTETVELMVLLFELIFVYGVTEGLKGGDGGLYIQLL